MLESLRAHDPHMVEAPCGRGSVLIPPSLNGRIFCQLDGELIHRLDTMALRNPAPTGYDNLGGNSLWPAPEGGPFAFNYLPGSAEWIVQDGIAKAVPDVTQDGRNRVRVEKSISLTNRKGVHLNLRCRRVITTQDVMVHGYRVTGMGYHTEDSFAPLGDYSADDVLLAPWSLEQFPGAEDIVAFGKVADAADALNCDFYGDPNDRITKNDGSFTFRLGGDVRHQIGVNVQSQPTLIGALDIQRSMMILRKAQPQRGVYFNIADNEQSRGPYSATDLYSIFNGGELGFFELETIGAMQVSAGRVSESALLSQTVILEGRPSELLRYLAESEGLRLDIRFDRPVGLKCSGDGT